MKKIVILLVCFILACGLFCSCSEENLIVLKESDEYVVLSFDENCAGKTLEKALEIKKEEGGLDYTIEGGMITSINGIVNAQDYSSCWMIYTDDVDFSNTAWGKIKCDGKKYSSASVGVSELIVKSGKTYVFFYQTF